MFIAQSSPSERSSVSCARPPGSHDLPEPVLLYESEALGSPPQALGSLPRLGREHLWSENNWLQAKARRLPVSYCRGEKERIPSGICQLGTFFHFFCAN